LTLLTGLSATHGLEFVAATPEPATWALLLLGLAGVMGASASRRNW
jgi:hypothetical protein